MVDYWQVGSGSGDRDYSEECIDLGMAFVGGDKDPMRDVDEGDVIVLRRGINQIIAVGEVVEHPTEKQVKGSHDIEWLRDFVGWDLPNYCYVKWYEAPEDLSQVKGLVPRSLARIKEREIKERADEILALGNPPVGEPGKDVNEPEEIEFDEIQSYLISEGLENNFAGDFVNRLTQIQGVANQYYDSGYKNWPDVQEDEVRAFLVVPLLKALGWDERRIRLELTPSKLGIKSGKRIDIACFSSPYEAGEKDSNRENCAFLIEVKRFTSGVTTDAPDQVKKYAEGISGCRMVMVSNGYCYKAFIREDDESFSEIPAAYLNIRKPSRNFPLNEDIKGGLELLRLMLPQTWQRERRP
ncbi:MAG: type I restriction enzyme HsdR N-terminal domain-containing protein [Actinomycetota bacterium]|jgi:hypothetical protein|nr:type I restriction enzyme HsdR N-terminal domain-containing protein [Actinomycetota bacterium]